jgi:hypothetical protein
MTVKKKNQFKAISSADYAEPEAPKDTSKMAMGRTPDLAALVTVLAVGYGSFPRDVADI